MESRQRRPYRDDQEGNSSVDTELHETRRADRRSLQHVWHQGALRTVYGVVSCIARTQTKGKLQREISRSSGRYVLTPGAHNLHTEKGQGEQSTIVLKRVAPLHLKTIAKRKYYKGEPNQYRAGTRHWITLGHPRASQGVIHLLMGEKPTYPRRRTYKQTTGGQTKRQHQQRKTLKPTSRKGAISIPLLPRERGRNRKENKERNRKKENI